MFTEADLELLRRPLQAMVTVAPKGDRWPAPRPVWYELTDDGDIQIFSLPEALRIKRLREMPRASVVVSAPVGEPEYWVSVEGSATMHTEGARELAARLAERYYGPDDTEHREMVDGWQSLDLVRIVMRPERVSRGG